MAQGRTKECGRVCHKKPDHDGWCVSTQCATFKYNTTSMQKAKEKNTSTCHWPEVLSFLMYSSYSRPFDLHTDNVVVWCGGVPSMWISVCACWVYAPPHFEVITGRVQTRLNQETSPHTPHNNTTKHTDRQQACPGFPASCP